jgi:hypothetical protein
MTTRRHLSLHHTALLAATIALLLAALLRIYHLNHQSLWFDEAFAWNIVIQPDMYPRIAADTHPPLYYLLLRVWIALAGDSVIALRYLSTLISLLTVALVYRIALDVLRLARWGIGPAWFAAAVAAVLMALTDADIDLAQEARNYTLYTMLACLSMWAYVRWIAAGEKSQVASRKRQVAGQDAQAFPLPAEARWLFAVKRTQGAETASEHRASSAPSVSSPDHGAGRFNVWLRGARRNSDPGRFSIASTHDSSLIPFSSSLLWVLANAALIYTHYQGTFIPAIQGLHALIFLGGRRRIEAVALLAVSGLLFAPWFLLVTVPQAQRAIANDIPFSIPSNWDTIVHLRREFFGQQWPLMGVLCAVGWIALAGRGSTAQTPKMSPLQGLLSRTSLPFLLAAWLIVPFVVLFIGNLYAPLLTERKLAMITPAIALLAAFGVQALRRPAAPIVLVAVIVYGLAYVDSYRLKEPWDEIAAAPLPYAQPGDLALIEVGNGQYPMKYYWERWLPDVPDQTLVSTFPALQDPTLSVTTDWYTYYDLWLPQLIDLNLQRQTGHAATAWVAFWSKDRTVLDRLESAGYARTLTQTWVHLGNAIDLYRYDRLPAAPVMTFDGGLNLRGAEIDADDLRADLWWSVDQAVGVDYVTSAFLLDAGGALVAQLDSQPQFGQRPTPTFAPGEIVFDPKALTLTGGLTELPPGEYQVGVQVYRFIEGGIQNMPTAEGENYVVIGMVTR